MKVKLLIIDDETILVNNIKEYLKYENFEGQHFDVDVAKNGSGASKMLKSGSSYDIVLLDLIMPEVDGVRIIETINQFEPQKRPWVILITAHPADNSYVTSSVRTRMGVQAIFLKPFELSDLVEKIKDLVKSRRQLLEAERNQIKLQCNWTLVLSELGMIFILVNGVLSFADSCFLGWTRYDQLAQGVDGDLTGVLYNLSGTPRQFASFQAKRVGIELFKKLFVGNILQSFIEAGSAALHGHNLKLTIVGPREFLRYPVEFLHDGSDFLILRHPIKRVVAGVRSRRNLSLSRLLEERHELIRVLLVASNTIPPIDSVDEEVELLHKQLQQSALRDRLVIDYLPTERATYEEVMKHLEACNYHIMHYAGHGQYNKDEPEKSSLLFWEKKNGQKTIRHLSINRLKNTLCLKGYDLRFMYLSCCFGTATSDANTLLGRDFLGIADGLIQVGVPSVLGFRWPVSDSGAQELALAFYESLFEQRDLDTALFHARCKIAGDEDGLDSGDWLSPILIVQG